MQKINIVVHYLIKEQKAITTILVCKSKEKKNNFLFRLLNGWIMKQKWAKTIHAIKFAAVYTSPPSLFQAFKFDVAVPSMLNDLKKKREIEMCLFCIDEFSVIRHTTIRWSKKRNRIIPHQQQNDKQMQNKIFIQCRFNVTKVFVRTEITLQLHQF